MNAIGMDLGTHFCGWAAYRDGKYECGAWDLRPKRNGDGFRYLAFRLHFTRLVNQIKPSVVFYENVRRHRGTNAAHVYGGYRAQLRQVCVGRKIRNVGLSVGTIKKHATGNGRADKPAMLRAARVKWPQLRVVNDDMADALWALDCGLSERGADVGHG